MSHEPYVLDRQAGFLLRRAMQRHLAIFVRLMPDLTPPQFAVLAKLQATGPLSQNALGREVAMDAATIKGVVDRLSVRGLVETGRDASDRRRIEVTLSATGVHLFDELVAQAAAITSETLQPLLPGEREIFLDLLERIG